MEKKANLTSSIGESVKDGLKKAETTEKNTLPTKEGKFDFNVNFQKVS